MTKEEMKAYGLQVGVSQSRIDEVISCVLDSWDDTMVKEYLSSVGDAHKACRLNPHTDYTDATLKQRMTQHVAGKSEADLKKEADDIAAEMLRHG